MAPRFEFFEQIGRYPPWEVIFGEYYWFFGCAVAIQFLWVQKNIILLFKNTPPPPSLKNPRNATVCVPVYLICRSERKILAL